MVNYCYELCKTIPEDVSFSFYMEAGFIQGDLLDAFDEEGDARGYYLSVLPDTRKKPDKYERIEKTSFFYERGFAHYNVDKKAHPDFATGVQQLTAFEKGSSAPVDFPDACEGALSILNGGYRASRTEPVIVERTPRTTW